jgi:hypothetical protein
MIWQRNMCYSTYRMKLGFSAISKRLNPNVYHRVKREAFGKTHNKS